MTPDKIGKFVQACIPSINTKPDYGHAARSVCIQAEIQLDPVC